MDTPRQHINKDSGLAELLRRVERLASAEKSGVPNAGGSVETPDSELQAFATSMAKPEREIATEPEGPDAASLLRARSLRKSLSAGAQVVSAEDFDRLRREREMELNRQMRLEREAAQQIQERKKRESILGHSGIPKRFEYRHFDNFEARTPMLKDAAMAARKFVNIVITMRDHEESPGTLMLLGAPGLGKTHLGVSMVRAAQESGLRAFYSSPHKYLKDLRRSFDLHNTAEVDALYGEADLLVLDEVARITSSTEFYLQSMFQLIDYRYENNLPTVLIGNHHQAEIKRTLGEAIWRRIEEDGLSLVRLSQEPGEAEMTHNLAWRPSSHDPYDR